MARQRAVEDGIVRRVYFVLLLLFILTPPHIHRYIYPYCTIYNMRAAGWCICINHDVIIG